MKKTRSDCPISCSLDVFGDTWSLLIIRDIMLRGKVSYSEFLESEEKIATNILVNRLSVLEAENLLTKQVSSTNKSKFIYSLTEKLTCCRSSLKLWIGGPNIMRTLPAENSANK